jgi:GT2 family glycosyltransferase
MSRTGIVVIGRNEGERLRVCLSSAMGFAVPVVYVDSGSTDGSPALAATMGATVLELDPSRGFSAARARNEGFARLMTIAPGLTYVQFVDGDSELLPGWLDQGVAALDARPDAAIVCGRLKERHPEASVYNRLCALEWQKTPGEVDSCGGIFLVRLESFHAVSGFRDDVIAAEEDELCLRLRRRGAKILHVDTDMAWHDAGLLRFSQWWRRAMRAGHAYAQGAALHGSSEDRHFVRDCRRIWLWSVLLPVVSLAPAWPTRGISLIFLALYPIQFVRIWLTARRRGWTGSDARVYSFFSILGKFPGLLGMLRCKIKRLRGKPMTIIEHKHAGTVG